MACARLAAISCRTYFIRPCSTLTRRYDVLKNDKNLPVCYNLNRVNYLNTKIAQPNEDDNFIIKFAKKLGRKGITKQKIRLGGFYLYENVVDEINYPEWFEKFKLDDTFLSWFLITELHVWMIMVKAMSIPDNGVLLRNHIVEALWADCQVRVKKLGPSNSSILRKQLQMFSEQFNAAIVGYDEGILSGDIVLAGAIWRRFFQMNCNDPILIEKVVKFVRQQMLELDKINNTEYILKPKINLVSMD